MADHMTAEQNETLQQFLTRLAGYRGQEVNGNRLAADAAAHLARLSGMAADTWQPIETAPKDAPIFGHWKGYKRPCVMWWNFKDTAWESWTDRNETPSHWMPIPAAPEPPHV